MRSRERTAADLFASGANVRHGVVDPGDLVQVATVDGEVWMLCVDVRKLNGHQILHLSAQQFHVS